MSKKIIISDTAHAQLCNIAKVLKTRRGRAVTFVEVIDYLLSEHAS